ncbi:MAG: nuclear transport factor 2 family protein [Burkholderiaceae bacterium]
MPPVDLRSHIHQFIRAAEDLSPRSLESFSMFYAPECRFADPFQTVVGRTRVLHIYKGMFDDLEAPCFRNVRLLGAVSESAREAVIGWEFEFALDKRSARQSIAGCSRLLFNDHGEIQEHVDHWDASQLMQALPLIGRLIAWLRRKIGRAH